MLVDLKEQQEIVGKYEILIENLKKWQNTLQQEIDGDYKKGKNHKSFWYNEEIIDEIKFLLEGKK